MKHVDGRPILLQKGRKKVTKTEHVDGRSKIVTKTHHFCINIVTKVEHAYPAPKYRHIISHSAEFHAGNITRDIKDIGCYHLETKEIGSYKSNRLLHQPMQQPVLYYLKTLSQIS